MDKNLDYRHAVGPPDSSTYNIGRDTEIFQVGHSSPIYYYEFQFTKIDFEPGYRYYIPVATYRNYDYSYCKVPGDVSAPDTYNPVVRAHGGHPRRRHSVTCTENKFLHRASNQDRLYRYARNRLHDVDLTRH